MQYQKNGIVILPENIQALRVMTEDEIGEVMKRIFLHVTGIEQDEEAFSSERVRFMYLVLKKQIDSTLPVKVRKETRGNK